MPREEYDATVTQETQTFSAAETEAASSGYPGGVPPFRQSERRQNGTRSHARHGGTGEAGRAARQAYPQDGYQDTASNPAGGYQGSGSYQGSGGYQGGRHTQRADTQRADTQPGDTRTEAIRATATRPALTRPTPTPTEATGTVPRMTRGKTTGG